MTPQKKMKKRKELNALIGLSDSSRKKNKQTCGHRLLRTEPPDTESESSSEEQEFNRTGLLPSGSVQCCSLCYPLCIFIVLAACVMACAGLIWMQISLKQDLDLMKEKIRMMESSQQLSSHEIVKLSEDLKEKERKLSDMESGERSLTKLWSNVTDISQKLSAIDSAVNHLKTNIKSAADLIALPRAVEELQKSVATIGSTLTSVQHDVTLMQSAEEERRRDQLKEKTEEVRTSHSWQENNTGCFVLKQEIQFVQDGLQELNTTQLLHQSWSGEQIQSIHFVLSNLTRWMSTLQQSSSTDDNRPAAADHKLPTGEENSTNTGSSASRHPRFLSRKRHKRGRRSTRKTALFPGISSVKDLERVLCLEGHWCGGLTYEELRLVFGSDAPDLALLQPYDADGDEVYTLEELHEAVSA
ncbi:EF-hand calcium-binding domain-containing protein 14 [Triplophysa dalaica]|uniref:EF-hand calcium-binding domain-containing protein 14 n=1 Tax=Triplophysa dalaica TaxID=1582913 RepID=UPI0024DF6127|nr:EF-hand calcium-binding domain-containing protein 14 [Triplophysa dalaica]